MAEEENKSIIDSVKKQLTCAVCNTVFKDPRILPCLHSFCSHCLESLVRGQKDANKPISCPTCRQESDIHSRRQVRNLPINTLLTTSLDMLSIHSGESIKCDVCDDSVAEELTFAVARCRDCAVYLCKLHDESHRRAKYTRRHTVLSKQRLLAMSLKELYRPISCELHTTERLELFCETCNTNVCRTCALQDHKTHVYQYVDEAVVEVRPKLASLLDNAKSVCIRVEKALPTIDGMLTRVNLKADSMIKDVDDCIITMMRALENRRKELHAEVEMIRTTRKYALQLQKGRLCEARDNLRGACHFSKRALEEGDPIYILTTKDYITQTLESLIANKYELHPREDHYLNFTAETDTLEDVISSFGSLDKSYAHFTTSVAEGIGLSKGRCGQTVAFTVITRDREGRPFIGNHAQVVAKVEAPGSIDDFECEVVQREHGRHHVTYTPSVAGCHRLYVTVRGLPVKGSPFAVQVAHGIRSYSDITEPQLTFGGSGSDEGKLSGARGLTVDEKGRTLVCDRDNFRVQVFDATGKYLFTIGCKGQKDGEFPGGPFDVAVTKDGRCRIVVTDWSGGPCQIFESTGEFVTKFGSQGKQDEQFGQFCHIEAGPQGEIYVSDYHNRQIQVFDRLGNFLFKFTGSPAEDDGLLSSPNGIVLNNKGELVVAQANNGGFQVFDRKGKPVQRIAAPKPDADASLFIPEEVAIDRNNNILAIDSNLNFVFVFSEEGELLAKCANKSVEKPFGIAVDRMGRIVVCDSTNTIKLF